LFNSGHSVAELLWLPHVSHPQSAAAQNCTEGLQQTRTSKQQGHQLLCRTCLAASDENNLLLDAPPRYSESWALPYTKVPTACSMRATTNTHTLLHAASMQPGVVGNRQQHGHGRHVTMPTERCVLYIGAAVNTHPIQPPTPQAVLRATTKPWLDTLHKLLQSMCWGLLLLWSGWPRNQVASCCCQMQCSHYPASPATDHRTHIVDV
jgi:hypothetical protein